MGKKSGEPALPKVVQDIKDAQEIGLYVVNGPNLLESLVYFDGTYFWAMKRDFVMSPVGWHPDVEVRGPLDFGIPRR